MLHHYAFKKSARTLGLIASSDRQSCSAWPILRQSISQLANSTLATTGRVPGRNRFSLSRETTLSRMVFDTI